jgi:hypothetical protein
MQHMVQQLLHSMRKLILLKPCPKPRQTLEAHLLLLSGPAALHREALYHYNMGCYLTVLGRRNEAQEHLDQAFRLDRGLRDFARKDRDLEALWPEI